MQLAIPALPRACCDAAAEAGSNPMRASVEIDARSCGLLLTTAALPWPYLPGGANREAKGTSSAGVLATAAAPADISAGP